MGSGFRIGNWDWGLVIGIGNSDYGLGLGNGIGDWDLGLRWRIRIGDWDWGDWGLGLGIRNWGLGFGIEIFEYYARAFIMLLWGLCGCRINEKLAPTQSDIIFRLLYYR